MMKIIILAINTMVLFTACNKETIENPMDDNMNKVNIISAVTNNDIAGAKTALENGADVNTVDSQKRSLLLIATNKAYQEMAALLVSHGADVNQQADNLDSPFLYAGASGQTELLELFLKNGARFDVFNRYNGTALIPACERGHVETVNLLANTPNFPIDHINNIGWTGLLEAIVLGDGSLKYQQIVQILKDAGADMTIPDKNGVTPLQHAQKRGYTAIANIIQS